MKDMASKTLIHPAAESKRTRLQEARTMKMLPGIQIASGYYDKLRIPLPANFASLTHHHPYIRADASVLCCHHKIINYEN